MKLQDRKRVHLDAGGLKMGIPALILSAFPLLPLFETQDI